MIRALVADDEAPARARLARMLRARGDVEVVGEASDGVRALEEAARLGPDALFLDIDMPELGGLDVALALGSEGPAVVFVTAHDSHALKAFELSAVDYLVKPIADERLAAAVARLKSRGPRPAPGAAALALRSLARPRKLAVRTGARFVVCDPSEISALVARDHYTALVFARGARELLADDPLDAVSERLDPERFVRVHRGAAINLDFLRELKREGDRKYVALLADEAGTEIQVSRERLAELKSRLGLE